MPFRWFSLGLEADGSTAVFLRQRYVRVDAFDINIKIKRIERSLNLIRTGEVESVGGIGVFDRRKSIAMMGEVYLPSRIILTILRLEDEVFNRRFFDFDGTQLLWDGGWPCRLQLLTKGGKLMLWHLVLCTPEKHVARLCEVAALPKLRKLSLSVSL